MTLRVLFTLMSAQFLFMNSEDVYRYNNSNYRRCIEGTLRQELIKKIIELTFTKEAH